jgi:hypothetical protein
LAIGLGVGIASPSFMGEPPASPAAARPDMHARPPPVAPSVERDDPVVSNTHTSSIGVVGAVEAERLAQSGAMSEPERQTIRPVVRDSRSRAARRVVQRARPQVNAKSASRVRRGNATKRRSKTWGRRKLGFRR